MFSADVLAAQLEQTRGVSLSGEEAQQLRDWEDGKQLHQLVGMPGWNDVVLALLQTYVHDYVTDLAMLDPSQHSAEKRLGAQAVAFASQELYKRFLNDVERLLICGRSVPQFVKDEIQKAYGGTPATGPLEGF